MNIHKDRDLYILIAGVAVIVVVFVFLIALTGPGLKIAFFCLWMLFLFYVYVFLVTLTIRKSFFHLLPKRFVPQFIGFFIDQKIYRTLTIVYALLALALSIKVWDYLDQQFPDSSVPQISDSVMSAFGEGG